METNYLLATTILTDFQTIFKNQSKHMPTYNVCPSTKNLPKAKLLLETRQPSSYPYGEKIYLNFS